MLLHEFDNMLTDDLLKHFNQVRCEGDGAVILR